MGWFDGHDDDSDEEEERRRKRAHDGGPGMMMMGNEFASYGSSIVNARDGASQHDRKERNNEEPLAGKDDANDEEDALDAYMNNLGKQAKADDDAKKSSLSNSTTASSDGPSAGRLDVENEEEATSHWETPSTFHGIDSDSPDVSQQSEAAHEAAVALQNTFHSASNQQLPGGKDPHRQVDIQLQQVQHDTMDYTDFQKCLLSMEGGSNNGSSRNTYEGHKWRKEHHVTCHPPLDPVYAFAELRDVLPQQVLEWNASKHLTQPTLVQSQTLGVSLCGKDAIVTASTGSGKTLSYLWPLAAHLMANQGDGASGGRNAVRKRKCRALILVPTRELALQVEQVAKSLLSKLPLTAVAITGGNLGRYQLSQQLQSTKPHLIVATPGRLLDVLSAQQKSKQEWLLPNITFLVLDEADKMIQMGFANQVTQILQNLRPDRQSLLVSATFDSRLQRRCEEWMHQPSRISVGKTGQSSKNVLQHVICLPTAAAKLEFLKQSLPTFVEVGRTLVFCATRQGVESLANELRMVLSVETLHGDKHPSDRKAALKAFTKGDIKILVATDVAGRGLDIPQVSTVINFDPAKNWDTHVHRIGRAGRLSAEDQQHQEGSAYTLLLPSNTDFAKALVRAYEREDRPVPDDVRKLANTSSKRHHGGSEGSSEKKQVNRSGLGWPSSDNDAAQGGHYGPSRPQSQLAPSPSSPTAPVKKGRWS